MTTIVVDQINEDVALVEWDNGTLSVVETNWLPTTVEEGDTLTVKIQRVPLSNCKLQPNLGRDNSAGWLSCDAIGPLYLPMRPSWWGRVSVYWAIQYTNPE